MKKFTVLIAMALLAATGTSYAVTCSQDNVPAATLLVPYFQVTDPNLTAATGDLQAGGVDTLVSITNVSLWGVVAHVTVWNKQSAAVFDFNVPMTGYDVAFFSMRDVLNGNLNVNYNTQVKPWELDPTTVDPCKDPLNIGDKQPLFLREAHPVPGSLDQKMSIGHYQPHAFGSPGGTFRDKVFDSLDESPVYSGLVNTSAPKNDTDNPACAGASDHKFTSSFAGYITIDVVNFCTNFFPNQAEFYTLDAIATRGWDLNNGPNVLMGDVFYVDPAVTGGNISGDPAVAIEFDERLEYDTATWALSPYKTFYGRYSRKTTFDDTNAGPVARFSFKGDGREPLGTVYGFRYLANQDFGLQTWATIWRADWWDSDASSATQTAVISTDLCTVASNGRPIDVSTWDNDEGVLINQGGGGPSGDQPITTTLNVWWEANRINIPYGASDMNPAGFKGGWTRFTFNTNYDIRYNQAYVAVQHTAPGAVLSVGHSATLLDNQFQCPAGRPFTQLGNVGYGLNVNP